MLEPYETVEITVRIRDDRESETMGSKLKWWFKSDEDVLLKLARPGTGEDWSEKVAFEIGLAFGLPCPPLLELATYEGRPAVLCQSFLGRGESLIHGNEVLCQADSSYPLEVTYRASAHKVSAVAAVLQGVDPPSTLAAAEIVDGFDAFVGYLTLDALVGNTDRHHQNWGVIRSRRQVRPRLAPSYDHASSLGRDLTDSKRQARFAAPTGRGSVGDYANRARSALWNDHGSKLTPLEALRESASMRPSAFEWWRNRLNSVGLCALQEQVDRVPDSRLTQVGKKFARELLEHNFNKIAETRL